MASFKEFMQEKRLISRAMVLTIGLIGALFGAILMFMISLLGLVS